MAGHRRALSGVIAVADASPLHYLVLIGHIDHRIESLNLADALARLRRTNFRATDAVFAETVRDA